MDTTARAERHAAPWNSGIPFGQKPPLKLKETWAIRIRLQSDHRTRELALLNLAIDSKLRGCNRVGLRVHDVVQGKSCRGSRDRHAEERQPVQVEITAHWPDAVAACHHADADLRQLLGRQVRSAR
jgi:hypothetical protein